MSPQNYGELPAHPFEAKKLTAVPEGWSRVAVIGERELFEPTPSNKTKAEQYDESYGESNWGITPHELADGAPTQLIDVVANIPGPESHTIAVEGKTQTHKIPVLRLVGGTAMRGSDKEQ